MTEQLSQEEFAEAQDGQVVLWYLLQHRPLLVI